MDTKQDDKSDLWFFVGIAAVIFAICIGIGGCCALINMSEHREDKKEQKQ